MAQRTYILGGGESGAGAAVLAHKLGQEVFLSDGGKLRAKYADELTNLGIEWEEGGHTTERILQADVIVKSPGIPEHAAIIKAVRAKGIPVISEIEYASKYTSSTIVGITGSNGKSTCTTLTNHIFQKAGLDVGMGGNIGKSFARMVANDPHDTYVLELSSFQLDDIDTFRPHVAVLLNITPDHLDRYDKKFENYVAAKYKITKNQTADDHFIYCADDAGIMDALPQYQVKANKLAFGLENKPGMVGYLQDEQLIITHNKTTLTMSINDLALQGKHNAYNSLAAGIAARIFDIKKDFIRESLSDFKSLDHRLEFVARIKGVEYINDSKATNVNSTWYALESMNKPVVWIVGGVDKGNDYEILKTIVRQKVKAIICLGVDNLRIHDSFSRSVDVIMNTQSAEEAVRMASSVASSGDAVLLSPACASFDLFENYEDRGDQFKHAVREL